MSTLDGASESGGTAAGPAGFGPAAGVSDASASPADTFSAQQRQLGERLYPKVQTLQPVGVTAVYKCIDNAGEGFVEHDGSAVECRTPNRESSGSNGLCYLFKVW